MSTTWGAPIAKGSDVWQGPGKPVCYVDYQRVEITCRDGYVSEENWLLANHSWWDNDAGDDEIISIRFPADHDIYRTVIEVPAPLDEAAQAAEDWTVAAAAHIARVVEWRKTRRSDDPDGFMAEARRIAHLPSFPKAVDPLLIEMRQIAFDAIREAHPEVKLVDYTTGEHDDTPAMKALMTALRRGIEIGARKA